MRTLFVILAFAFSFAAQAADPCPQGNNAALTSNTRSTESQQPQGVPAPQGHTGFGSTQAQRTAYPH
jgi:hypothetical protein